MRIFVAGASGVIGRRLVPRLVEAGHEVTGMTRSADRTSGLRDAGAEPVVADALDPGGLETAVREASPEVVVHQLTAIPKAVNPRRMQREFALNDRLRIEGTANLVAAGRAAGARRIVAQSVAFMYAPEGQGLKSEADPLWERPPPPADRSVGAVRALEEAVLGAEGLDGVVLRYGYFYGPGTSYASDGTIAEQVRRRRFPIVGAGTGSSSFVHVDDAAGATLTAVEGGPPGVYNVVDDDPAPVAEWLPLYAEALGARPPRRVPAFVGRLAAGPFATFVMIDARGASNARARERLGWAPRHASWRQGFLDALG